MSDKWTLEKTESGAWKITLPNGNAMVGSIMPELMSLATRIAVDETIRSNEALMRFLDATVKGIDPRLH